MKIEGEVRSFPKDFQWGVGSASWHMEGNKSGERDGHVDLDQFLIKHPEKSAKVSHREIGPDWWSDDQYQQDIDTLYDLGVRRIRMSLEQGRIHDGGPQMRENVLQKYRGKIDYNKRKGFETELTVNHFTLPREVTARGGWHNKAVSEPMRYYTEALTDHFGDVTVWYGINEPSIAISQAYINGDMPPGYRFAFRKAGQARKHMQKVNHEIYDILHRDIPDAKVGPTVAVSWFEPRNPDSRMDRFAAGLAHTIYNGSALKDFVEPSDFIGVDYYTGYELEFDPRIIGKFDMPNLVPHEVLGARFHTVEGEFETDSWPTDPVGFLKVLKWVHEETGKRLRTTENGVADHADKVRAYYIASDLIALHEAITYHNIPIDEYIHMAAIDNIDWLRGLTMQFGLIGVNWEDYTREVRESGKAFGEVARTGELRLESFEHLMTEGQIIQLRRNMYEMERMRSAA